MTALLAGSPLQNLSLRNADQIVSEVSSDSYILLAILPNRSTELAVLSHIFHWWEDSLMFMVRASSKRTDLSYAISAFS